jgi:hypothetical protein
MQVAGGAHHFTTPILAGATTPQQSSAAMWSALPATTVKLVYAPSTPSVAQLFQVPQPAAR